MTESIHRPLVIDVAGTTLAADDRRRLAHPLVGGVIHFARNWESRAQMSALNAEIKSINPHVLICVDHEGGRVQRFRTDGFTRLPSMRSLGELWMRDAMDATRVASAVGFVLASELRAVGVDFSFAPVLDLDHESDAPRSASASGGLTRASRSSVIGDRSFHRDPRVVALLAKSVMHGMLQAGMSNCGKHFPGHGFVQADSHTAIPIDRRGLKAILADDARPFEWLAGTLGAVMPAHVIYPRVDSRPAGFSSKWLQDILRGRLGFQGAIFSDDLSMEAGRYIDGELLSYTDAALAALEAGCDMAMLCNQSVGNGLALDQWLEAFQVAGTDARWTPSPASEWRRCRLLPGDQVARPSQEPVPSPYQNALRLLAL